MNSFSLKFNSDQLEKKFLKSQESLLVAIHKTISICILIFVCFHLIMKIIQLDLYRILRNTGITITLIIQYYYFQRKKPELLMIPIAIINLSFAFMNFDPTFFVPKDADHKEIYFFLYGIVEMTLHYSLLQDPRFLINFITILLITIIQIIFANYYIEEFTPYSLVLLLSTIVFLCSNYISCRNKRSLYFLKRQNNNWGLIYKNTIQDAYFKVFYDVKKLKYNLLEQNESFYQQFLNQKLDQFSQQIRKIKITKKQNLEQYLNYIIKKQQQKKEDNNDLELDFKNFQVKGKFIDEQDNCQIVKNLTIKVYHKELEKSEFIVIIHDEKENDALKKLVLHQVALEKLMEFAWKFVSQKGFEYDNATFRSIIYQFMNQILNLTFLLKPSLINQKKEAKKFNILKQTEKVINQLGLRNQVRIEAQVSRFNQLIYSKVDYYSILLCNILSKIKKESNQLIILSLTHQTEAEMRQFEICFRFRKKKQVSFFHQSFETKKIQNNAILMILKKISPKFSFICELDPRTNCQKITVTVLQDLRALNSLKELNLGEVQ